MLSSDKASEFVIKETTRKEIKKAHSLQNMKGETKLSLMLDTATSDYVFNKCLPIIRGLCISSQVNTTTLLPNEKLKIVKF